MANTKKINSIIEELKEELLSDTLSKTNKSMEDLDNALNMMVAYIKRKRTNNIYNTKSIIVATKELISYCDKMESEVYSQREKIAKVNEKMLGDIQDTIKYVKIQKHARAMERINKC